MCPRPTRARFAPTAMMFPQTPFAQHTPNGPFGPPAALRTGSVSGAPPCDSNHYFHPLFNGFNAFGGPGVPGGPGGYYPGPPPGSKQARNSAAGDKGRTYQPSPLKPGLRKSSGSGAFAAPVALLSRPGSISMGSGPMLPGATMAPPLPPQVAMQRGYVPSQPPHQQRGHQYHQGGADLPGRQRSNGIADDDIDCCEDDVDVSPSQPSLQQQQPSLKQAETVVPRASLSGYDPAAAAAAAAAVKASVRSAAAAAAAASASQQQPSQEAIDATAAAAVVVAAAAAAAASMSANPTPRSSLSGLPVLPPHRSSTTGIPAAALPTPSARTSCSGIAVPAVTSALLPDDHSATLTDALEHDVGDVDAAYGAAGYGAQGVPASWAFYDTAGGPGLAAALPGWQGMMQARGMYPAQMPTMAMPMQHSSAAATLQQPLLQAAMLQQLAGMGGMPTTAHMAAAVPGGYYHDSLQHTPDYMAAAEHLAQLQALQGSLIAQQNLRAAAAAAAAAEAPHMVGHPVMGNPGLSPGAAGMLMNHPALLAGGLGHPGHNAAHPHMAALGMGTGMGARPRRSQQMGAGGSGSNGHSSPAGAGGAGDGQLRLNARQRRTLRRAKERAIRGLLEAGKLLVARTMGDGDDGTSGDGFDTDDVDEIPEGDMEGEGCDASPPRPQRQSTNGSGAAAMASPIGGPVAISRNASATGIAATTPAAMPPPPPRMSDSGIGSGRGQLLQQELQQQQQEDNAATSLATHVGVTGATVRSPSASSSNASSMFEGASSCGGVPSHASTHSAPSSGKASPLSAAVPAADGTAAGAVAAAAAAASSSAATVESPVPSARSSKTSIGTPTASRVAPSPSPQGSPAATATGLSAASSAMAALAAGNTSEADITALIQQLNQKREEGLIDDKLMRDLEVRARCREAHVANKYCRTVRCRISCSITSPASQTCM